MEHERTSSPSAVQLIAREMALPLNEMVTNLAGQNQHLLQQFSLLQRASAEQMQRLQAENAEALRRIVTEVSEPRSSRLRAAADDDEDVENPEEIITKLDEDIQRIAHEQRNRIQKRLDAIGRQTHADGFVGNSSSSCRE